MMPSRSRCLSRSESSVRESPGAPSRISLKFPQPRYRLRMISGVQRSAKISAPRAMGQYCPYVLTSPSVAHPPSVVKSRFLTLPLRSAVVRWAVDTNWPKEDRHEKSCTCCDRTRCRHSRAAVRKPPRPGRLGRECDDHRWLQLPHAVSVHLRLAGDSRLSRDPRACGTQVLLLQRGVSRE